MREGKVVTFPTKYVKKPVNMQEGGNSLQFTVLTNELINLYAFRKLLAEWDL